MTLPTKEDGLDEILDKPNGIRDRLNKLGHFDAEYNGLLLDVEEQVESLYILKADVLEALGEDVKDNGATVVRNEDGSVHSSSAGSYAEHCKSDLRAEIRQKLNLIEE